MDRNHRSKWIVTRGAFLALLLAPQSVIAATHHVSPDGSFPHTNLASAVAAAASGDTIRIAAGDYPGVAEYTAGDGHTFEAIAFVEVPTLTILGESRETTVLGPEMAAEDLERAPFGINQLESAAVRLVVRDVTIRHVSAGVAIFADGEVTECTFQRNYWGVGSEAKTRTYVADSRFIENVDSGIILIGSAAPNTTTVENCEFRDNLYGIDFQSDGNALSNSTFEGDEIGTQVSLGGSASITGCVYTNNVTVGIAVLQGCSATLNDNRIRGVSRTNLISSGFISGTDNVFAGGTEQTMLLVPNSTFDFQGNHILNGGSYTVWLPLGGLPPLRYIDLSGNYWGTDDSAQIAEWIFDHQDFENTKGEVVFEPYFPRPVSTERKTFGGLKALYSH